jgi:5'-3' exonuclease
MNKPTIALIDGDLWCYDIPFAAESGGDNPSMDYCITAAEYRMENILQAVGCKDLEVYLTGSNNFRTEHAKTAEYKANRGSKPKLYKEMREWMQFKWNAQIIDGMEADDQLAIRQTQEGDNSVIVSRDKDLRMVEGWHYGYSCGSQPEFELRWIDKLGYLEYSKKGTKGGGIKFFFAQLLMGDKTDNILGVKGVGAKKAYDTIEPLSDIQDMFDICWDMYDDLTVMLENADLLWMVTELTEDGKPVMFSDTYLCKELVNNAKNTKKRKGRGNVDGE